MSDLTRSAFAPATVANLGPGFDSLGLALDPALGLGDRCDVRLAAETRIVVEGADLPTDPARNVATVAAMRVLELAGVPGGVHVHLRKGLPIGSGLGSSAASAVSAVVATHELIGRPLGRDALIDACRAGEAIAAGFPHPDNVVPALLGGLLLMVEGAAGLEVVPLPVPQWLRVAVVIPDLEVRTADARAALPAVVPMADAVANAGAIGLLISALYDGDADRIGRGVLDRLHQPYRIPLVPGFDAARRAALDAGALGVGLSGSGPALFALARGEAAARNAGAAMASAFQALGTAARWAAGKVAGPRLGIA